MFEFVQHPDRSYPLYMWAEPVDVETIEATSLIEQEIDEYSLCDTSIESNSSITQELNEYSPIALSIDEGSTI